MIKKQKLIFEKSKKGRSGFVFPDLDVPSKEFPGQYKRKKSLDLPEVSELDVVRHFTGLSNLNFSVDTGFYPLGSCTMKYNPKMAEVIAGLRGFKDHHPFLSVLDKGEEECQGSLEVIYEIEKWIAEITGMDEVTTQPLAGAHGELAGVMVIAAYHKAKKQDKKYMIVPDSSHGTNPATVTMAGYKVITIPTDEKGVMDIDIFKEKMSDDVAGVMLTCPNTLGIFNPHIKEIADIAHSYDALLYYDGANLNAIMGKVKPGEVGFDVIHVNVHKTFATPHGGGGPGAGPIGVTKKLTPFLPNPRIKKDNDGKFYLNNESAQSIGRIAPFFGNFNVLLKGYAYLLMMGKDGLIDVSEKAVLNANYILENLKNYFEPAFDEICMHECVLSAKKQKAENNVSALDIAKYLIENGVHPPTVYFPLIVKECMMIEPTETENKETLDEFIEIMIKAAQLCKTNPELLHNAPSNAPVNRPDETKAAREPDLKWQE